MRSHCFPKVFLMHARLRFVHIRMVSNNSINVTERNRSDENSLLLNLVITYYLQSRL